MLTVLARRVQKRDGSTWRCGRFRQGKANPCSEASQRIAGGINVTGLPAVCLNGFHHLPFLNNICFQCLALVHRRALIGASRTG